MRGAAVVRLRAEDAGALKAMSRAVPFVAFFAPPPHAANRNGTGAALWGSRSCKWVSGKGFLPREGSRQDFFISGLRFAERREKLLRRWGAINYAVAPRVGA